MIGTVRVLPFARAGLVGAMFATTLTALLLAIAITPLSRGCLVATLFASTPTARLLAGVLLFLLCHHRLLRGATLGQERLLVGEVAH